MTRLDVLIGSEAERGTPGSAVDSENMRWNIGLSVYGWPSTDHYQVGPLQPPGGSGRLSGGAEGDLVGGALDASWREAKVPHAAP